MSADTIKLVMTYLLALIVVVGGGTMLFVTRLDPQESSSREYGLLIAGFIGIVIQWAFSKEAQTQTARQMESAVRAAQSSPTP